MKRFPLSKKGSDIIPIIKHGQLVMKRHTLEPYQEYFGIMILVTGVIKL